MLEHYEFILNGNQSISGDATAMYRKLSVFHHFIIFDNDFVIFK